MVNLSMLCKLTSLVAGELPMQQLQASLPALQSLKRLQCTAQRCGDDWSERLPALSRLPALEELHLTSHGWVDWERALPPTLGVCLSCMPVSSGIRTTHTVTVRGRCMQLIVHCPIVPACCMSATIRLL